MFQGVECFFNLLAVLRSTLALDKMIIVFKFASTGAALGFFITAIAVHPATGWEFSHTMFVCPCLVFLTVFAVYRREYFPVYIIKILVRPVVVGCVVGAKGREGAADSREARSAEAKVEAE